MLEKTRGQSTLYIPLWLLGFTRIAEIRISLLARQGHDVSLLRSKDGTWGAQIDALDSVHHNDTNPQVTRTLTKAYFSEAATLFLNNIHRIYSHTPFHLLHARRHTPSSIDQSITKTATRSRISHCETHHRCTLIRFPAVDLSPIAFLFPTTKPQSLGLLRLYTDLLRPYLSLHNSSHADDPIHPITTHRKLATFCSKPRLIDHSLGLNGDMEMGRQGYSQTGKNGKRVTRMSGPSGV